MGTVINLHRRTSCMDTYPDDIIWQAPGTPARQVQMIEIDAPEQYRCEPAGSWGDRFVGLGLLLAVGILGFILGELSALAQIVERV